MEKQNTNPIAVARLLIHMHIMHKSFMVWILRRKLFAKFSFICGVVLRWCCLCLSVVHREAWYSIICCRQLSDNILMYTWYIYICIISTHTDIASRLHIKSTRVWTDERIFFHFYKKPQLSPKMLLSECHLHTSRAYVMYVSVCVCASQTNQSASVLF